MRQATIEQVRDRIKEFYRARGESGANPALVAEAALFVEEVFDLALNDEEICSEELGTADAMERLVARRLGGTR